MYDIVTNLDLVNEVGADLCVVEESPEYPGELVWQTLAPQEFYAQYKDWLSRFLILSQSFTIREFVKQLENDGWRVKFLPSAVPILESYVAWEVPLEVEGFRLPNDGSLYNFQSFSLNRALERNFYFWGWCPGTGKTCVGATAGSQELFNREKIDVVLAITLTPLKINLGRFFEDNTSLSVVVNDGMATKRHRVYGEDFQVFVINYDKLWADFEHLKVLVRERRTLFILDECQAVITDGRQNRCRKHLDKLIKHAHHAIVWPMSATVVNSSPFRYRDVFSLGASTNPLGGKGDFEQRYVKSKKTYRIPSKYGHTFQKTEYKWDHAKLHEVRHRVARQAHSVRKTDLGVRENFQGLQNVVVPIQMSEEDRRFYDVVEDLAKQAMETDQNLGPYYRVLRYICNNPESLHQTKDEVGQRILRDHPGSATAAHCAKLQILLDTVESIRDADDRCVVFTQWTNLSLFQLHDHLERRKIRHVLHYGAGQSARESQAAQQRFKRDRDITVFLSSDAGAFGLNLQECRYVINYEVPYSYDTWMQRINRIDRVDSYLENLTAYNFITEATVEERIWRILNQRRELAAATLGTNEELSYENENSPKTLSYLIFGEK